jgi:predicted metalloenzyme YecM
MLKGIPWGAGMIRWNHFPFGRPVKLRPEDESYHRRNMREYIKKQGIFPKSRSRNPKGEKNRLANVSIAMAQGEGRGNIIPDWDCFVASLLAITGYLFRLY